MELQVLTKKNNKTKVSRWKKGKSIKVEINKIEISNLKIKQNRTVSSKR